MKKKRLLPLLTLLVAIVAAISSFADGIFLGSNKPISALPSGDSSLTIHFIDVGQADSALLISDGQAMLIDGGNVADSSLVAAYLKEQNISHLDYMVATHAHEDHVGGLSGALNVATVGTVYSPVLEYNSKAFRDFVKYVEVQNKALTLPTLGEQFTLGSATVEILAPQKNYSDTNNTSIVLKVTHGTNTFLSTGDAERESENEMMDAVFNQDSTLLKLGHHGSNNSTS